MDGGSLVVALPETPPTAQRMGVLRAQLSTGTVELRSSPLETITNGPAEEPPSGRQMAAFGVQPAQPDDWYWPMAGRLPSDAYAGAPPIRIAHLDTGIGAHPSFAGRYDAAASINPVDFPTDPKGKGVICWPKPLPWDLVDHGTSTAAMIIGELTTNPAASGGISGLVPPGVAVLIPARVLSDGPVIGPFDVERVVAAIDWAVTEAHCQVISISIGYPIRDQRFEAAVQRAFAAGVIVCAAAGQIAPTIIWPAATADRRMERLLRRQHGRQDPIPRLRVVELPGRVRDDRRAVGRDAQGDLAEPRLLVGDAIGLAEWRDLVRGTVRGGHRRALARAPLGRRQRSRARSDRAAIPRDPREHGDPVGGRERASQPAVRPRDHRSASRHRVCALARRAPRVRCGRAPPASPARPAAGYTRH